MSRFKQYIIEQSMTFDMALKIFGITSDQISDKIALKRKYRQLAMQHHPDKGGSEEITKDINNAYEILSKTAIKNIEAKTSAQSFRDRMEKEKKMAEQLKQSLMSDFHPEIYQRYFNELSGLNFKYEITKAKYGWPGFEIEFFTPDKKSVFTLSISADFRDVMRGGLSSGDEFSYTIHTVAYGFHLNKKQKMSKTDWGFTRDHSFLSQPEKIFPKKKMNDIFSGATSKRAFKKRDMETYLKSKLNAKISLNGGQIWAEIPLGEEYYLFIYRTTFQRMGTWGVNGIYQQKSKYTKSRVSQPKFVSFMEEEETAKILDKIQKEVMKVNGENKIKKTAQLLDLAYSAYKKSKGME